MKMKAAVLTVCGAPRPFAKSKPIHVVEAVSAIPISR